MPRMLSWGGMNDKVPSPSIPDFLTTTYYLKCVPVITQGGVLNDKRTCERARRDGGGTKLRLSRPPGLQRRTSSWDLPTFLDRLFAPSQQRVDTGMDQATPEHASFVRDRSIMSSLSLP